MIKQRRMQMDKESHKHARLKEDEGFKQMRLELDRLKHQQAWKESKNEEKTLLIAASGEVVQAGSPNYEGKRDTRFGVANQG